MGGIKHEQSDASQQPKPSHSADQTHDEVGSVTFDPNKVCKLPSIASLNVGKKAVKFAVKDLIDQFLQIVYNSPALNSLISEQMF